MALLQQEITQQGNWLREYYYEGHIKNGDSVENLFYDLLTTPKRRNKYLYPSAEPGSLRVHAMPQLLKRTGLGNMEYIWPGVSPSDGTWLNGADEQSALQKRRGRFMRLHGSLGTLTAKLIWTY